LGGWQANGADVPVDFSLLLKHHQGDIVEKGTLLEFGVGHNSRHADVLMAQWLVVTGHLQFAQSDSYARRINSADAVC